MARITDESKCLTGTVGNVVFYEMNGIMYARTKPQKYHDAKTDKQLAMRGRFSGCSRFYKQLEDATLRHVWKTIAKGSAINAKSLFMQHNIHAFGKDKEVSHYGRLQFSAGLLPLPENLQIKRSDDHNCIIQWEHDPDEGLGSPYDILYIVEFHQLFRPGIHETGVTRQESKAVFSTYESISKYTHLYCFWSNEQRTSFSGTHYFKEIPPAE